MIDGLQGNKMCKQRTSLKKKEMNAMRRQVSDKKNTDEERLVHDLREKYITYIFDLRASTCESK